MINRFLKCFFLLFFLLFIINTLNSQIHSTNDIEYIYNYNLLKEIKSIYVIVSPTYLNSLLAMTQQSIYPEIYTEIRKEVNYLLSDANIELKHSGSQDASLFITIEGTPVGNNNETIGYAYSVELDLKKSLWLHRDQKRVEVWVDIWSMSETTFSNINTIKYDISTVVQKLTNSFIKSYLKVN